MRLSMGNMKIAGKIISGVILILTLAAIMGGIALYNMRSISGVLNRVTSQNAPSVEYVTGVERYALRTILSEKSYLLFQEKEIHQQAMQDINEIYVYLDKVDKVAKEYGDEGLLEKSKEVRGAVRQYQAHYNKGVATIEENTEFEEVMRRTGMKVNELASAYIADKDKEIAEALKTGIAGKEMVSIVTALSVSIEILREALEARRQEKNYILYGKAEYFNKLKEHVANLVRLYDELEFVSTTSADRIKISQAREATKEYLAAANNWVINGQKLKEILLNMRDLGINVQETAMAAQRDGWEAMSESKKAAGSTIRGAFIGTISSFIIMIIVGIVAAILAWRSIVKPIAKLHSCTEVIGKGNLDYKVGIESEDEIGQLSRAFDRMTRNLKTVTASRDELDKEVAERKRAEEKLQFQRNKVISILDSMADGLYIVNQQYDIEYANLELKKEFGAVEEGKCYECLQDRKEVCPWCKNQEVFAGKTVRFEWHSSRNQKTYDLIHTPLKNPDGSISNLVIFRDITERKQTKKALQESERRLAQAVVGNSIPTFLIDGNHFITHWNKSCENLTGISAAERVGTKKTWSVFYAEERPALADLIVDEATEKEIAGYYEGKCNKSILTEGAYECEDFYPDLGEKGKWLLFAAAPLRDQHGKIVGAIETFQDITKRKRAEEALKEYSERLEGMVEKRTKDLRDIQEQLVRKEKLAVLGQLAGGVAHELRNPLGVIKNAAYFLNMVVEEPEPKVKETLEILEKEVGTSERIISSLLDFARSKPPTRRKVNINDAVREALSRAAVPDLPAQAGNVEVVSQLDDALPAILADPDQLGQVFGNIALNAIQAMPEGGQLVVKTSKTSEVSEKLPKSGWVAVSFADTGMGIPEENLDKMFEPLFTTKDKGIGLGLAVTQTLVEGHGGAIEVQSEVGKGSTFTVRLPMGGGEEK